MHPDDVPGFVDEFLRCHAEQREFHAQARVRRHDGQWRWLESFAAPRFSGTGEYLGMAGSSVDITERRQAEAVLARDKEELERLVVERTAKLQELVGELEHFSYTITHDMRAPLRAMMAFAHVLEEVCDSSNREQKDLVRRIGIAAKRMDLLITDALNYSKAVRSELPLAPDEPETRMGGKPFSSVREPARLVLVGELSGAFALSAHERKHPYQFNNARNVMSFVDGHVSYIPIYWNGVRGFDGLSFLYAPPEGYEYRWSER